MKTQTIYWVLGIIFLIIIVLRMRKVKANGTLLDTGNSERIVCSKVGDGLCCWHIPAWWNITEFGATLLSCTERSMSPQPNPSEPIVIVRPRLTPPPHILPA